MTLTEIDRYLGHSVERLLQSAAVPEWPDSFIDREDVVCAQITLHGIAPVLCQFGKGLPGWPPAVALQIKREAAHYSFWEASHRATIAPLLAAFHKHGIAALVTKGTALAYSLYPQAAMRPRGDTDILISAADRARARDVLTAHGFFRSADTRALQEDWHCNGRMDFSHTVDIHWRVNASAAISRMLEQGLALQSGVALPRLHETARAIDAVGNLILTCINRTSHGAFGYWVGHEKVFAPDRLSWALDIDLLARSFGDQDWRSLVDQATKTRTSSLVRSGLGSAQHTFSSPIPEWVAAALAQDTRDDGVEAYFTTLSAARRLGRDVAAAGSFTEKSRVLYHTLFADAEMLAERFPDAQGWPAPALHLRRWAEGALKLVGGKLVGGKFVGSKP